MRSLSWAVMSRALEHDAAGGGLEHAQDGETGGRLAAAALADEPQRVAALQRKAHAVDRLHGADLALDDDALGEGKMHL